MKKALSIAGSDCSGGAGVQADLKTMSALGVYAMSVITSVVAENTCRVIEIHDVPARTVISQMDAVFTDIVPDAVKVGMLNSVSLMDAVADKLAEYAPANVVVDPVMVAKGGAPLMEADACGHLAKRILPLARVVTPNLPEAEVLSGMEIGSLRDMKRAAARIREMGPAFVLVKGGHAEGSEATDVLFDGQNYYTYSAPRVETKNTHGTGCTYSSAIAAGLALGYEVQEAVARAKRYVTEAIRHALDIGCGHGPTDHFYALREHGEGEEHV